MGGITIMTKITCVTKGLARERNPYDKKTHFSNWCLFEQMHSNERPAFLGDEELPVGEWEGEIVWQQRLHPDWWDCPEDGEWNDSRGNIQDVITIGIETRQVFRVTPPSIYPSGENDANIPTCEDKGEYCMGKYKEHCKVCLKQPSTTNHTVEERAKSYIEKHYRKYPNCDESLLPKAVKEFGHYYIAGCTDEREVIIGLIRNSGAGTHIDKEYLLNQLKEIK